MQGGQVNGNLCLNRRRRRRGRNRIERVLLRRAGSDDPSTVCTSARARDGLGLLKEELSGLGWTTESLLRTMRLDVMLLGSREEEMREALAQLEGQREVLEMLLEEQRGVEEEGGGDKDADEEKSLRTAERLVSTIDWDGGGDLGDGDDNDEGEDATNNMPVASDRRKPPP